MWSVDGTHANGESSCCGRACKQDDVQICASPQAPLRAPSKLTGPGKCHSLRKYGSLFGKKGDLTEWEMVIYNLLKEDTVHWSQIGVCMCADVPRFYLAFNQWSSSPSIVIYFCMLIILQPLQFKALPWESIQRGQEVKDFAAENIPVCLSWKSSPSVNPCFCMLETELTLGKPVMSTKLSTRLTGIVDY